MTRETLNKYHFFTIRHSGESRNPVETISYWMPVFTGMTVKTLLQRFPRYHAMLAILLLCMHTESRGDSCPSPEKIRHRDLSKQYEWTVDDKTTLQDLLSVKKLYAARIMDHGLYVSCYYTTDKWTVRLDAAPVQGECSLTPHDGKWKKTESGQDVCTETIIGKCGFTYTCKKAH